MTKRNLSQEYMIVLTSKKLINVIHHFNRLLYRGHIIIFVDAGKALKNPLLKGEGVDGELGVNRCKLLPLERISNEILLCSSGNYVQSLMMEHDHVRK